MEKLSSFSHKEVQMILCGNQCPSWTSEDIVNYTEPKSHYTRDSPGFLRFVRVLCSMSSDEKSIPPVHHRLLHPAPWWPCQPPPSSHYCAQGKALASEIFEIRFCQK
ncbi:hypothetical protein COCON_G00012280 [Conger conger]|uniref:E3 ubiquitin-protein ligase n=1 Tax=Conger conger TaxID=82655 RepID=A0A9Q1I8D6_CONCO|nr:hypothetical protein COCON_G00012280 [Conger conger]